jgi:ATP-dependent Zn protease
MTACWPLLRASTDGMILGAATNCPDDLNLALLRPG